MELIIEISKRLKRISKQRMIYYKVLSDHPGPLICESGIKSEKEVEEIVKKTKINNFLIGESLLKDLRQKTPPF